MDAEANAREVRIYRKFAIGTLSVCGITCLIGTGVFVNYRLYALGVVALCWTTFCALGIRAWVALTTATAWAVYDAHGTTVRIDKRAEQLLMFCMSSFTAGIATFVLAASMDWLGIPFPTGFAKLYILFLVSCVGLASLAPIVITLCRPGLSTVRLTPESFAFSEGLSTKKDAWNAVTAITNDADPKMRVVCPISFELCPGTAPKVLKNTTLFAPNGEILLEYVRFYWQHPGHRGELTDSRATARLLTMQETANQSTT